MAILPRGASYTEFCDYVVGLRGTLPTDELDELWALHQKLSGIRFETGRGYRSSLPPDEQHLSREELGRKTMQEAQANGRSIERLSDKVYF